MKKYGVYDRDGNLIKVRYKDKTGRKSWVEVRAGTKGAARRLAKEHDGTWRKDGKE